MDSLAHISTFPFPPSLPTTSTFQPNIRHAFSPWHKGGEGGFFRLTSKFGHDLGIHTQGSWAVPSFGPNTTDASEPILGLEIVAELEGKKKGLTTMTLSRASDAPVAERKTNTFAPGTFFRKEQPGVRRGPAKSHIVSPLPHTYLKYACDEMPLSTTSQKAYVLYRSSL
jgi:hypothetical protein